MDRGHSRLYLFDPDSGRLPEVAAPGALLSGAGRGVVTLIVAPDVIRSSWSPAAAVALARAWFGQGHRVLLCDLSLTRPVLHEKLGLPNAVGIIDVVLREAPIPSVAQQAGTPGFQFVSVGTPIEDPTEVTLSDEWAAFVEEVVDAQATVLFYVPSDLPGVDALVARSAATLLLAGDPAEAEWVAQSFALDDVAGLVEDRGEEGAQAAEPPEQAAEPPEQAAEPLEQAAEPLEQAAEPLEQAAEPLEQAAEPLEQAAEPLEQAAEPLEQAAEPLEQAAEPLEQAAEPLEQAAEPLEQAAEPLEQAAEPLEAPWRHPGRPLRTTSAPLLIRAPLQKCRRGPRT